MKIYIEEGYDESKRVKLDLNMRVVVEATGHPKMEIAVVERHGEQFIEVRGVTEGLLIEAVASNVFRFHTTKGR